MSLFLRTKSKSMLFCLFQHRYLQTSVVVTPTLIYKESAISSKSDKLNPKTTENHESVLNLLKSFGFSDAHIAKAVAKKPCILRGKVYKTLKPKLDCFAEYGISGSFLHELIVLNPILLYKSLNSQLQPTLHLLQTYLGSNDKKMDNVRLYSWLLGYGKKTTLERNLNLLASEGVPIRWVAKLICLNPRVITQKCDRMVHAVKLAKQFGFRPVDPMFVRAVNVILTMKESTFAKKIEYVKNLLGCSEADVHSAIKRYPLFMRCSEEKLEDVTNFFMNTLQAEASVLLSTPVYFSYSVGKRMMPRYNVYKILESKKLLKEGLKFHSLLPKSEKLFERTYVVKYMDQVPNLMELYRGFSNPQSSLANAK